MPSDWPDVLLHMLLAAVATAVITVVGFPFFALIANSVGWPIREALQVRQKKGAWSVQNHWEAWAPVLVGWLVVAEVMAYG